MVRIAVNAERASSSSLSAPYSIFFLTVVARLPGTTTTPSSCSSLLRRFLSVRSAFHMLMVTSASIADARTPSMRSPAIVAGEVLMMIVVVPSITSSLISFPMVSAAVPELDGLKTPRGTQPGGSPLSDPWCRFRSPPLPLKDVSGLVLISQSGVDLDLRSRPDVVDQLARHRLLGRTAEDQHLDIAADPKIATGAFDRMTSAQLVEVVM